MYWAYKVLLYLYGGRKLLCFRTIVYEIDLYIADFWYGRRVLINGTDYRIVDSETRGEDRYSQFAIIYGIDYAQADEKTRIELDAWHAKNLYKYDPKQDDRLRRLLERGKRDVKLYV